MHRAMLSMCVAQHVLQTAVFLFLVCRLTFVSVCVCVFTALPHVAGYAFLHPLNMMGGEWYIPQVLGRETSRVP